MFANEYINVSFSNNFKSIVKQCSDLKKTTCILKIFEIMLNLVKLVLLYTFEVYHRSIMS